MTDEINLPDEVAIAPDVARVAPVAVVRHQRTKRTVNPVTAETLEQTVITDDAADVLPARVTLAAPYGFYDDAGVYQSWAAGQVVQDAAVIALLVARGAIFEVA